jgi:hypothetical protein
MSEFLVEVYVPRDAVPAMPGLEHVPGAVQLLRSIFVPADETCFYLFEGQSGDAVHEAATRSGLRVERVVEPVSSTGAKR